MKRLRPSYELVLHRPLLLVGTQRAVLGGDLFFQFLEAGLHEVGGGFLVEVMDREFEELAGQEAAFHRSRLAVRQESFPRLDSDDAQSWLIPGKGDINIQRMSGSPNNQFFRRIAPAQAEGRFENALRGGVKRRQQENGGRHGPFANAPAHGGTFAGLRPFGKAGSRRRGMLLVESMIALSILTVVGLVLLKLSLNVLHPRQWVLQQTLTDAYMSYERAVAERIPFDSLLESNSPWPAFPTTSTTDVEIGRLPGNHPVMGKVTRTRIADPDNPIDGALPSATNPAAMKVWKVQSVVTYTIGNKSYAKSRTVLRSQ
jgi:type II secretory pathway pseudopilin PulG